MGLSIISNCNLVLLSCFLILPTSYQTKSCGLFTQKLAADEHGKIPGRSQGAIRKGKALCKNSRACAQPQGKKQRFLASVTFQTSLTSARQKIDQRCLQVDSITGNLGYIKPTVRAPPKSAEKGRVCEVISK